MWSKTRRIAHLLKDVFLCESNGTSVHAPEFVDDTAGGGAGFGGPNGIDAFEELQSDLTNGGDLLNRFAFLRVLRIIPESKAKAMRVLLDPVANLTYSLLA